MNGRKQSCLASRREDNFDSRKVSFQPLLPRIRELVTQTTDRIIKADQSMKAQFGLALIVFGLSAVFTQTLSGAQVLAVASNGKWDLEYDAYGNLNALAAKAIVSF